MRKYVFLFTCLFLALTTAYATPPTNLACAKNSIIHYYESDEYTTDVNKVIQDAEAYLLKRVEANKKLPHPKKLAMILDIDDTSLNNFNVNLADDFSSKPEYIYQRYLKANSPAISGTLRLYNEALKNSVAIFFISFRPDSVRSYTIKNLHNVGYYGWKELYLPNADEIKQPSSIYKTKIRKMITQAGYEIILNIGDQNSDFEGGYAEHTDKIPNAMYTSTNSC